MIKRIFITIILVLIFCFSCVVITKQQNLITNLETQLETQDKTYSGKIDELTDYQQSLVVQLDELTSQNEYYKQNLEFCELAFSNSVTTNNELKTRIASLEATIAEQQATIDSMVSNLNSDLIDGSITKLTPLDFENVTEIRPYAFANCKNLKSVEIPSSVVSIGKYAFDNCTELSTVKIDSQEISVGAFRFANISNLELGDNVSVIDVNAFSYAFCSTGPDILTIPVGISVIGFNAFADLPFSCVIFEGHVEYLDQDIFGIASNLNKIVVPDIDYDYYCNYFSNWDNHNTNISASKLSEIVTKRSVYNIFNPIDN